MANYFFTDQPVSGDKLIGDANPLPMAGNFSVSNFPSSFAISNFPAIQPVSGTVTISALPSGTNVIGAVNPVQATVTDRSGTVTLGGTAQQMMAANASRVYLCIQNVGTATLWFNFTTTAVQSQPSFQLAAGASFVMEGGFVSTEAISVIGPNTGQAWTAKEK